MAHGITLTLREIQPPLPRVFWDSRRRGQYRDPFNVAKASRAEFRNAMFGRKPVGNSTLAERLAIKEGVGK